MGLLKPERNTMAYAKVGLYGEAGSGKTVTASKMAIGLHKQIKSTKPIAFFDTEGGASFVKFLYKKAGIERIISSESRSLKDLLSVVRDAEKVSDILIIDSVTHVWKEAQEAYINNINEKRKKIADGKGWTYRPISQIEFQDWRIIKAAWARFTNLYLCSKLHVFVLGRAATNYEYQENERTGKKELIQGGTKMATEKELAYEPSLLIEMIKKTGAQEGVTNLAFVEKDRNIEAPLTGKLFEFPEFHHFKPHFDFYNIGGEHQKSMEERNSHELYEDVTVEGFSNEKRQREIQVETIKDMFIQYGISGTASKAKEAQSQALNEVFNTGSWTQLESTNSTVLKDGIAKLKYFLDATQKKPDIVNKMGVSDEK